MAVESIDIRVREDGARVVKRNLEELDPAARKAAAGVDFLKNALRGLGIGLLVREVLQTIDAFTNLQNRLRSTGLAGNQLATVYDELLRVSNETRSSIGGSVELYSRLAVSAKDLGTSQKQLIDFTQSLNQAILLSGASATEAEAGLIQLSQGMASGVLRGDELSSVMEQLPAVADVIAKQLGVTRGELRKMGEDGKITAQTILQAFTAARQELADRFAKTVPTLSQSFQVLRNNTTTFIGSVDQATGFSAALSKVILTLAQNLDVAAKAAIGALSGLALVGGAAVAVRGLTAAVAGLTAAVAANPLGALLVLLTSAVTTLALFRDQIMLGTDSITTLGDYLRALGDTVGPVFRELLSAAVSFLRPVGDLFRELFGDVNFSLIGLLRVTAKTVDTFVGLWRGAVAATVAVFEGVPPALVDIFTSVLNRLLSRISAFVNKAGELLNTVTEFAGLGKLATAIDFTLTNESAGAAKRLGSDVAAAFSEGFDRSNPAQQFVDDLAKRAEEIGQARREAERLALRYPAGPSAVVSKPAPSSEELKRVKLLADINKELSQQETLLRTSTEARDTETQLIRIQNDLQKQGVTLTTQEVDGLRARIQAINELNGVVQQQDAIYAASIGKRVEFENQLRALQNLTRTSAFTTEDKATATADIARSAGLDIEGTQVAIDAQIAQFEAMYARIGMLREKNLIDEQTAQQLNAKVALQQTEERLKNTQSFFGNLATLSRSGNAKLAAIGKAAAISQATIDGVLAVQKALSSAPPPVNYVLAAAVGAAAAANVAAIAKQGFESGGYTGNVGKKEVAGVVHGQEFVSNAESTRKNRPLLEALNRGEDITLAGSRVQASVRDIRGYESGGYAGPSFVQPAGVAGVPAQAQPVTVIVNNNASGTTARTQEREGPNGRELEVIIEQVASRSITGGGRVATAIESQYGLNRAQGASY